MSDKNREEVIEWCIGNKVDFTKPSFPPPEGWMWCDPEEGEKLFTLTAIFTNTEDEDVDSFDVFLVVASRDPGVKIMLKGLNE